MLMAAVAFVLLPSCTKYLEKKPNSSLVVPRTLADLQGMMDDYNIMNQNTPAMAEASTDDFFVLQSTYYGYEDELRKIYSWQPADYNYQNDWANAYTAVYNCNYCLERVEKVTRTEENNQQWNYVKGAAFFYRAFWFAQLAGSYSKAYDEASSTSDLGIVLRLGSDYNIPSKRATVRETYERIITDLKKAAPLLPDFPPAHLAQASKAAAYAMLARTYISMRQYDSAGYYAGKALTIKHDLLDYNDPSVQPGVSVPFEPYNREIIFYTTEWVSYRAKNPSNALVDSMLYASFDDNDMRKTVFFRPNNGYWRFKGSYASATNLLFSGLAVDELYLIRAEANARAGKLPAAMEDLNTLLEKRWATGTFVPLDIKDQATAIVTILLERRKQLMFRNTRWADIKRLNKEGAGIIPKRIIDGAVYTLEPNSPKYALPLPKDIIDMTGMEQN